MVDLVQIPVLSDNYVYLLHDAKSQVTAVVDPAVSDPVLSALRTRGWMLTHILCTHHHNDHIGGVEELKAATGAVVIGALRDQTRLPPLDMAVSDGDRIKVGGLTALVIDTPGHTVGHICYWFAVQNILFCGDTLFSMGCGRLFEGTARQMWQSMSKLLALPEHTQICCAHEYTEANGRFALTVEPNNPDLLKRIQQVKELRLAGKPTVPTTLKLERATNPFLRASDVEAFADIRRRKDVF